MNETNSNLFHDIYSPYLTRVLSQTASAEHDVGDRTREIIPAGIIGDAVQSHSLHQVGSAASGKERAKPHADKSIRTSIIQIKAISGCIQLHNVILVFLSAPLQLNDPKVIIRRTVVVERVADALFDGNVLKVIEFFDFCSVHDDLMHPERNEVRNALTICVKQNNL